MGFKGTICVIWSVSHFTDNIFDLSPLYDKGCQLWALDNSDRQSQRLSLWFYISPTWLYFFVALDILKCNALVSSLSFYVVIGKILLDLCEKACKSWFYFSSCFGNFSSKNLWRHMHGIHIVQSTRVLSCRQFILLFSEKNTDFFLVRIVNPKLCSRFFNVVNIWQYL